MLCSTLTGVYCIDEERKLCEVIENYLFCYKLSELLLNKALNLNLCVCVRNCVGECSAVVSLSVSDGDGTTGRQGHR